MDFRLFSVNDYVLFQVEKEKENELETKIGVLFLDTDFDPGRHARIYGEVLEIPKKLTDSITMWREDEGQPDHRLYYSGELAAAMAPQYKAGKRLSPQQEKEEDRKIRNELYYPSTHNPTYKTLANIVPEVQAGDRIYFHYSTVHEENRIRTNDGRKIFKVRYDNIFCVVRDEKIIPIGGWVLVDPIWDEEVQQLSLDGKTAIMGKVNSFGLVTELHEKPKKLQGKIAHIGTPLKGDPDLGLTQGDKVYFLPFSEFKNTVEGSEYYIMRQKDLIAKIE